ncbi:MAG: nicotinate (nicotinamide) nucleotide adenylyltransferase [Acutalibacteraceae bacterium]
MKRVGIFGGTFNPPHLAHKRLALEMKEKVKLDQIIVIPTFIPPHKAAKDLAGGEDRLKMCKLTFFEDFFFVSDTEIMRQGKSYTYDTLCQLKKNGENEKLFLIIGSDMLLSFDKWYRYKDILTMATLCAVSRQDDVPLQELRSYAKDVLGLCEEKGEIIISSSKPFELSSTLIREKIKNGEDVSGYIEKNTFEYITQKELYK